MKEFARFAMMFVAAVWLLPRPLPAQEHGHERASEEVEKEKQEAQVGHGMKGRHGMAHGMMGPMMSHPMMGRGMGGHDHGMMAGGPGPMMLLHQKEALELSDAQVRELEGLHEEMKSAMETARTEIRPLREELEKVSRAEDPDLGRYESLLQDLADRHVQLRVRMARTHRQAMQVLTDQQRAQVRYGMRLMRQMMREHEGEREGHGEKGHEGKGHEKKNHGGLPKMPR